jgi:hypothetical protein
MEMDYSYSHFWSEVTLVANVMHKIYLQFLYMFSSCFHSTFTNSSHMVWENSNSAQSQIRKKIRSHRSGSRNSTRFVSFQSSILQSFLACRSSQLACRSPIATSLHANPHNTHHNIHPLALPTLILETPHPIPLIVPVRAARTVHTSTPDFPRLSGNLSSLPSLSLSLNCSCLRGSYVAALYLARLTQVLNNRTINSKLIPPALDVCGV